MKMPQVLPNKFRSGLSLADTVACQPAIRLVRWSIFELGSRERHLVGFCIDDLEGRVSSSIESFDAGTGRVVTTSGGKYQLVGPPGHDHHGYWLWSHCIDVVKYRDVSGEYLYGQIEP